jgi:hypothetical protein
LHYPLNPRHRDPSLGEAMANLASDPAAVAYRRVSSSEKVIHLQRKSVRGSNVPHQSKNYRSSRFPHIHLAMRYFFAGFLRRVGTGYSS